MQRVRKSVESLERCIDIPRLELLNMARDESCTGRQFLLADALFESESFQVGRKPSLQVRQRWPTSPHEEGNHKLNSCATPHMA